MNQASGERTRPDAKETRFLIVRLSAMGDVIHTLPAVRALRDSFPNAHLAWLIEERWVELLCAPGFRRRGPRNSQRPLVDEVHVVNLKTWGKSLASVSTLQKISTVWHDVRAERHDAAIDLQGAIRSAVLAQWSGAREVYGSADPRESPASLWYSRQVIPRGSHVIEQNLSIVRSLTGNRGTAAPVIAEDIPRDTAAKQEIERRLAQLDTARFAILNPGAGWGAKRWPAERYGEVARELAKSGLRSILNYGPGEENLVRVAETASGGAARAMKCTISELIALTRRARLFVGGDTGPLHLAAALQVPVVGIYGPTHPARNGPYGTRSVVLRSAESVTSHARRAAADDAMLEITIGDVVSAARTLLSDEPQ